MPIVRPRRASTSGGHRLGSVDLKGVSLTSARYPVAPRSVVALLRPRRS